MLRPGNVATPATAATVLVPDKVPVLGLVPIATVTLPVNPVAVLPLASWAVTWTAGVIAAPATVFVGSTLKTRAEAAAGVMLNAALVVDRKSTRLNSSHITTSSAVFRLKNKTPATAATVL